MKKLTSVLLALVMTLGFATVGANAGLDVEGTVVIGGNVEVVGTVDVETTGSLTVTGVTTVDSTGTMELDGTANFTGGLTNNGTVEMKDPTSNVTLGAASANNGVITVNGGTLNTGGNLTVATGAVLNAISNAARVLGSVAVNLGGAINLSGGATLPGGKTGTGTLTNDVAPTVSSIIFIAVAGGDDDHISSGDKISIKFNKTLDGAPSVSITDTNNTGATISSSWNAATNTLTVEFGGTTISNSGSSLLITGSSVTADGVSALQNFTINLPASKPAGEMVAE